VKRQQPRFVVGIPERVDEAVRIERVLRGQTPLSLCRKAGDERRSWP
jgi:hypothetical protein